MITARAWAALAVSSMLLLLFVYVVAANRAARISEEAPLAILAPSGLAPLTRDFNVGFTEAAEALRADPLNQRLVNIAMLAWTREHAGAPDPRWFVTLGQLGRRDTTSQQNLLVRHGAQINIPAVLDDVDGLLRRNRLIEQLTPILLAMEADPAWQPRVVARLRSHPAWRFGYLQRGSEINGAKELAARARTIRMLQRSGDTVSVDEIAPVLPKLLAAGLGASAFAIWQTREPSISRPIADAHFDRLAAEREPSNVPFHWQLSTGPDYSVDATSAPVPHLTISWSGAGAPVFAAQYLSTQAGRYGVIVTSSGSSSAIVKSIGLRLVCGDDIVNLDGVRQLSLSRVIYSAARTAPCAFPRLEFFGRSNGAMVGDGQIAISSVAILPAS